MSRPLDALWAKLPGGNASGGPPRDSQRTVQLQDGTYRGPKTYADNSVKTSKYTPWNFLPRNLWEQLHKFGNVYFLSISILMYLGEKTPLFVGTIKAASTLATLMAMMALTAVLAALEDMRRHAADAVTNGQTVRPINAVKEKKWGEVEVGDVLEVRQESEFPADIVPLACPGAEGSCYVSTANLDGETNLKLKEAHSAVQTELNREPKGEPEKELEEVKKLLRSFTCTIVAEAPKASIHDFNGRLELLGKTEALGPKNLLLRGTKLRNTAWCVGVVVYTGSETRMVMNSREAQLKQSNLDRVINRVMYVVLGTQAFMALVSDILFMCNKDVYQNYWYLVPPQISLPLPIGYWLTFLVLYSNLMPISLYPTMEICNAAQSYFIKNDLEMYYELEDVPAGVRSASLCQELGQVNYIFSDKTGTLTQNVMVLKRILANEKVYGGLTEGSGFTGAEEVREARANEKEREDLDKFLEVLAVAHTVMVARDDRGERFEAESPDETALVEAVAKCGWEFKGDKARTRIVKTPEVSGQEYTVHATNQFDSTRKRMSVVVEKCVDKETKYFLFCKGADNVMLERAKKEGGVPKGLEDQLLKFAKEGLRTLVIARKELPDKNWVDGWLKRFHDAEGRIQKREEALAEVAEEVEKDMEVVGATAIEDKLQEEVEDTVKMIREADIKFWVLTGDKLETAKNIGFSSGVLENGMDIKELEDAKKFDELKKDVDAFVGERNRWERAHPDKKYEKKLALLITGFALEKLRGLEGLEADAKSLLYIAENCSIVIACRVSPLQKAQLVRLVRNGVPGSPVTLSIGDGANDVPMIQEAQVGVGIAGREGRQAVNNSDFSVGQFRYLKRLLFVHGRWNYRRTCKFTLFTFWRNAVQVLMICYYTFISGFSGTSLFEDWIRLSFNFLCSFPIMATGCFDQDVSADMALKHPELYVFGREGRDLDEKKIGYSLVSAFTHSIIIEGVTLLAFPSMDLKEVGDYYTFGTAVYTCLLVDMNYRVAYLNFTHNQYTVGSIFLSFVLYAVYLVLYPCVRMVTDMLAPNMYMVPARMVQVLIFWLCIATVPAIAMIVDMFVHTIYAYYDKEVLNVDKLRIIDAEEEKRREEEKKRNVAGSAPGQVEDQSSQGSQPDQRAPLLGGQPPSQGTGQGVQERGRQHTGCPGTTGTQRKPRRTGPGGLDDSDFAQQKLRIWIQSTPRPPVSLAVLLVISAAIVVTGIYYVKESQRQSQIRIHYEGPRRASGWWFDVNPMGTLEDEVHHADCPASKGSPCRINVNVPREMKGRILVYYVVGPFYQNYNDYLKSEIVKELMGQEVDDGTRERLCVETTRVDSQGDNIVPCGMKATSIFNDTFAIAGFDIDSKGIAWGSDLERFKNPPGYAKKPGVSWLYERYPELFKNTEADGVTNEHFAVWMRPSALWRVWNPYGWLDAGAEGLKQNQTLTVTITSNYPVAPLEGYKQLVLTTLGPLGGRHHCFGTLLIIGGIVCGILAVVRHLISSCHETSEIGRSRAT